MKNKLFRKLATLFAQAELENEIAIRNASWLLLRIVANSRSQKDTLTQIRKFFRMDSFDKKWRKEMKAICIVLNLKIEN